MCKFYSIVHFMLFQHCVNLCLCCKHDTSLSNTIVSGIELFGGDGGDGGHGGDGGRTGSITVSSNLVPKNVHIGSGGRGGNAGSRGTGVFFNRYYTGTM